MKDGAHDDPEAGGSGTPPEIADPERLEALRRLAILDTPAEEEFDELARLASQLLGTPIALICLVDENRQFFKSCIGLSGRFAARRGTPLSHSFCQHAVASRKPLLIEDARVHPVVRESPAITEVGAVAYAGIPLITREGHAIGTLCVLDREPRKWKRNDLALLRSLATCVLNRIELGGALRAAERHAEKLQESQAATALYAGVVRHMSVGVLVWKLEQPGVPESLRLVAANPAAARLAHVPLESLLGKTMGESFPSMVWTEIPGKCLEVLRSGETKTIDEFVYGVSGGPGEVFAGSAFPVPDGCVAVTFESITERKRNAGETKKTLSILSATLESTADGLLVVDMLGRVQSFNRRFVHMWRIPQELVATRDDARLIAFVLDQLEDPQGFLSKIQDLYARPEAESFDVLPFKDGRTFERYSQPQRIEGKPVGRVWSFRDITERRSLEAQLLHSQKMEAVGSLAGGVAHDFNNLLTGILGYSDRLLSQMEPTSRLRRDVEGVKGAAERAALLTRQLLAFSRRQVLEPKVLDLNVVVGNMESILRRVIGEDVDLVTLPASNLGWVNIDPGQVEQVVMNLAVNARDAMPDGGKLTIETANVELDEADALVHEGLRPGSYVRLAVSDTGAGMTEETRSRIFEPFFTTKERGKGTGLGLSTVYGIVRQSEGGIWVYSEPGQGSTFKVYLPRVEAPLVERPAEHARPPRAEGHEVILLAEDEELVRELVREILEERGYHVLTASNATEAMEVSSRHEGPIHILVTDVVMPGATGPELAKQLSVARHEMRVLYISGYTDSAIVQHGILETGTSFLQKPFSPEALARKVREVLDTPRPS
jgi:PAS domain S-box-containing protein